MEIERWGCGMIGRLKMIHQWYKRRKISCLDTSRYGSYLVALLDSLGLRGFAPPVGSIVTSVGHDVWTSLGVETVHVKT
jgi:hypothetical protein